MIISKASCQKQFFIIKSRNFKFIYLFNFNIIIIIILNSNELSFERAEETPRFKSNEKRKKATPKNSNAFINTFV